MIHIGAGDLAIESDAAVLRAALALSCATGLPFRWERFRRNGLRAEDAEAVRVFAQLSGARVESGNAGDESVALEPGPVSTREYRFDASADRSLLPLLRSLLVPLAHAGGESELTVTGATHAPGGDTFEVTDATFRYFLQKLGVHASLVLECAGFAPRGGGEVVARVVASDAEWKALTLVEREALDRIQIVSAGASLPAHVQQRQAARARSGVHISGFEPTVQLLKIRSKSAGSVVAVTGQFGEIPVTFASVSERGKSAETVGEQAAARFRQYAKQPAVVPVGLVDSLVPFLAFADGESRITTPMLNPSVPGQAALVEAFTGRKVEIEGKVGHPALVRVGAGLQT